MSDEPQLPVPKSGNSLIADLAGAGQIVSCIVGSIGSATGVLHNPRRIRTEGEATAVAARSIGIAKVDVEAYAIRERAKAFSDALSIISGDDLTKVERAGARLRFTMSTEELIIEQVSDKACAKAEAIEADAEAASEPKTALPLIDPDWVRHFVDSVKNVSNDYVQDIWATILARQAQGGEHRISLMTLDRLRLMEYRHAVAFRLFCCCYATYGAVSYFSKKDLVSNSDFEGLEELGFIRQIEANINDIAFPHSLKISADGPEDVLNSHRFFDLSFRGRELATIVLPEIWSYVEDEHMRSHEHRYALLSKELQSHILAEWAERYANIGIILNASVRESPADDFRSSHIWDSAKRGWQRHPNILDRHVPSEILLAESGKRHT